MAIRPDMVEFYRQNGWTLLEDEKPPVGLLVEGARLFIRRGFGGVIESTARRHVTILREAEHEYRDTLNAEPVSPGEIEAWKYGEQASARTSEANAT